MLSSGSLPLPVGQAGTDGVYAQSLGQKYGDYDPDTENTYAYVWVKNNSGGTLAAGDIVIAEFTDGVFAGNVTTTTTANNPNAIGIVPNEFGTNTVADDAYFALLVNGPGRPKFAQTTIVSTGPGGAALGTATTAGYAQLLTGTATGTAAPSTADVSTYVAAIVGRATATAGVTAAGQQGYAVIQCLAKV